MCSARRKPEKSDIPSTGSFCVVQEEGSRYYAVTVLRPVIKTGQAQPADGRSRKTTGSRPIVAKKTTQAKLAEKQKPGDTTCLRPMYENEAS